MAASKEWWYDEFKYTGTDYASAAEVDAYDERMSRMRDIPRECDDIFKRLELGADSVVLDMGSGTGEFALAAALRCKRVYAVDISREMLDCASRKASDRGADGVEFVRAGFLTYEHKGEPVDAVASQLVLHHLPDFWKCVALSNMARALKPGGKLFLRDVVFSFGIDEATEVLENWIATVGEQTGDKVAQEVRTHIKDEYSTFDWVMEGLLERTGFSILSADYVSPVLAEYVCQKR